MTSFSIAATFPLGVYYGHAPDGTPEQIPHFQRVYSALVQAAACGSLSTGVATSPLSDAAVAALRWLERHPPTAMRVPERVALTDRRQRIAYRKEGVFLKEQKATNYKVMPRAVSDGWALAGAVEWIWDDCLPDSTILATLDSLCADVPHLGETSSPVCLTIGTPGTATHRLDSSAGYLTAPGELRQVLPISDRLDELVDAHEAQYGGPPPTVAEDKHNLSSRPDMPSPGRERLQTQVYRPTESTTAECPWAQVLAVPVDSHGRTIPDERLVSVCVALHRAIISRVGLGVPPVLTGHYAPGDAQPANRVAIHYLFGDIPSSPFTDGRDRFLLLLPRDMHASDSLAISDALSRLQTVVTREHRLNLDIDGLESFPGDAFWQEPAEGIHRTWEAYPGVVPERRIKAGSEQLEKTTVWSVGNVFRDLNPQLSQPKIDARWSEALSLGIKVWARALRTLEPRSFVHRTNQRNPIHPYRAEIDLGDLVSPQTIVAIGQSRHLGCGLLTPVDRPKQPQEVGHVSF